MLQKIMFIIFLIWTIDERVSFLEYALTIHYYHKNHCEKVVISPGCFVCFWWGLQIWKEQSFNLITDMEAITQLLKSKFEQPKFTWRHQCHAFCQKGNFSLKMSIPTEILDHEFSLHSDSTFYNYLNFIVYLVPDFILANIYIYIYIYILYIYYVYILYIYIYIYILYIHIYIHTQI